MQMKKMTNVTGISGLTQTLKRFQCQNPPPLLLHDFVEVHRAGHHQQRDDHQKHGDLVGDVLRDDAGGGDDGRTCCATPQPPSIKAMTLIDPREKTRSRPTLMFRANRFSPNGITVRQISGGAITIKGARQKSRRSAPGGS